MLILPKLVRLPRTLSSEIDWCPQPVPTAIGILTVDAPPDTGWMEMYSFVEAAARTSNWTLS